MSPDTIRAAEDSVAEDRGYRNSLTKIEPYGIEHIPDVERHGKPRSQFFLWFAAGMNFPIVVLGFSATYFGLPFWAAVLAIILAGVISSAGMGYLSAMGVRLGVPQQMQGRGPLGFIGNLSPVAYVNVFAGIGWAAVTVILGGKAIALLTDIPFWLSSLILMGIQLVVAVIGYNLIHFLQRILSFVLVVGFVFITVVAAANGRIENTSIHPRKALTASADGSSSSAGSSPSSSPGCPSPPTTPDTCPTPPATAAAPAGPPCSETSSPWSGWAFSAHCSAPRPPQLTASERSRN